MGEGFHDLPGAKLVQVHDPDMVVVVSPISTAQYDGAERHAQAIRADAAFLEHGREQEGEVLAIAAAAGERLLRELPVIEAPPIGLDESQPAPEELQHALGTEIEIAAVAREEPQPLVSAQ